MQLVMQRSRELAPHATQRNAGVLTTCFALGQLSGPLVAALSTHLMGGLQPALIVAALGLLLAAGLLLSPANKAAVNEQPCRSQRVGEGHSPRFVRHPPLKGLREQVRSYR